MHIESAQGNYTHSWINFFSSIQKGKNSILVKLLPSYKMLQYSGKFTLHTNVILFLKLEIPGFHELSLSIDLGRRYLL